MGNSGGSAGTGKGSLEDKIENGTATIEDIDKFADEIFEMPTKRGLDQAYKELREAIQTFDDNDPMYSAYFDYTFYAVDTSGEVHVFTFNSGETKASLQKQFKQSGLTRAKLAYIAYQNADGSANVTGYNDIYSLHSFVGRYELQDKNYYYAADRILGRHAAEVLKRKYPRGYSFFTKWNQW